MWSVWGTFFLLHATFKKCKRQQAQWRGRRKMKAFSSMHNKSKHSRRLKKTCEKRIEQIFCSLCGFDLPSTACDISIKMREQKDGCQSGIR